MNLIPSQWGINTVNAHEELSVRMQEKMNQTNRVSVWVGEIQDAAPGEKWNFRCVHSWIPQQVINQPD